MCSILAKQIFPYILICPGVIAWYTYKTWATYVVRHLFYFLLDHIEEAGGFGVAIVYIYFLIGVIANRIVVSPLTKWTARVERCEGDFRYKHVSVRNNAEESAFYNAAEFEEFESNRFLMRLLKRQLAATLWKYPSQFLQNYYDYYGAILSYLIQIFPIFIFNSYKDMDGPTLAQQISNNAFYFIYLINSFTRLTDLALSTGEMAGYSQRDKAFLITGVSGVGKSSLLRIIRKLWNYHSGTIKRSFSLKNVMFLPQRPYFPPGKLSLRQQVVFPQVDNECGNFLDNNKIINILDSLRLRNLVSMCGGLTDAANFEWLAFKCSLSYLALLMRKETEENLKLTYQARHSLAR
ncbi:hypothetical protein OESDEN_05087 [Oesophagostomum dentatum]|uniref:ABC transmembrane type-1 domain-containing protein n=1 Tax=Oesophagostomum dentatum TaxID=61180 RepID=A0A0B1TGL5_OESDE|nr:hypothetical protein OESDEN_05087 [Oesophagostomum dentatum]